MSEKLKYFIKSILAPQLLPLSNFGTITIKTIKF